LRVVTDTAAEKEAANNNGQIIQWRFSKSKACKSIGYVH